MRDGEDLTGWQTGKVVEVSDYLLQRASRGELSAEHLGRIDTLFQLVRDARAAKSRRDWVEAMTPKPKAVIEPERSMGWRMAMTEQQHQLQQPHGRW